MPAKTQSLVREQNPQRLTSAARAPLLMKALTLCVLSVAAAHAHENGYTSVSVQLSEQHIQIRVRCHVRALVLCAPHSSSGENWDAFGGLTDGEVAARAALARSSFLDSFSLRADDRLVEAVTLALPPVSVLRAEAAARGRNDALSSQVTLSAKLPAGTRTVDLALPLELGSSLVVVVYPDGRQMSQTLSAGERTKRLRLSGPNPALESFEALLRFLTLGFQHILPLGLDHILFVIALTVGAPRLGDLIKLATTFTAAHSTTLALAAVDAVRAPSQIVEPAISLSIVVVAGLTLLRPVPRRERLPTVLLFGLLHGLGFAGALHDAGFPKDQEIVALLGFNVGVELGQLAVILLVFAALARARSWSSYRARIAVPLSLLIAGVGLYWSVERITAAVIEGA